MTGIERIAAEQTRQRKEEGFSPEHDRHHTKGELAAAAVCYAYPPEHGPFYKSMLWLTWPWDVSWWKPGPTRERDLEKAGALIADELDRLTGLRESNDDPHKHTFACYDGGSGELTCD